MGVDILEYVRNEFKYRRLEKTIGLFFSSNICISDTTGKLVEILWNIIGNSVVQLHRLAVSLVSLALILVRS